MTGPALERENIVEFDIVMVPRGSVDPKVVVGTVSADDVARVKSSRVRSARRAWRDNPAAALLELMGMMRADIGEVLQDKQARGSLGELAKTLDSLAKARSAFRSEIHAAIADGDAMLKAAG